MNAFFDEIIINGRRAVNENDEFISELYIIKNFVPITEEFNLRFRDIEQVKRFKQIVDLFYDKSQEKLCLK